MDMDLQPQKADSTVYEGEGGGYYAWTAPKTPMLLKAAVGAGKLVLQPRGFALPHYADTSKIGYVVQGTCIVGLISLSPQKPEERVIVINKGDAIPVSIGTISWWFNGGDSELTIIFLGESSQSYTPGQFDYFFLTGAIGILRGFSTKFTSNMFDLNDAQSKELVESQTNALIIKIGEDIHMPQKSNCKKEEFIISLGDRVSSDDDIKIRSIEITSEDSPLIEKVGLSPKLVRLEPEAVLYPYYCQEHQIMYVVKGGGEIQIVGLNGEKILDEIVEEGHLIVVPKFLLLAIMANQNGLEFFCVTTSPRPLSTHIAGNTSAYKALSSSVLEAALNVSPEFVRVFKSKF